MLILGAIVFISSCESPTSTTEVPKVSISGVLTDNDGFIVPNAVINVVEYSKTNAVLSDKIIAADTTDEDGNFTLTGVPEGYANTNLKVIHRNFDTYSESLKLLAEGVSDLKKFPVKVKSRSENCNFVLVNLSDSSGNPIAGAEVKLRQQGELIKKGSTNDNGFLQLPHLSAGTFDIRIAKEGYKVVEQSVVTANCDSTKVKVTMLLQQQQSDTCTKGWISVNPKDSTTNATIKNATVKLYKDGQLIQTKTTGSTGVKFEGLGKGKYTIVIVVDGYKTIEYTIEIDCNGNAESTKYMTSTDCCKGSANVVAKDSNGTVITNATVKFRQSGVVKADGNTKSGSAFIGPICEGTYSVLISADGYTSKEMEVVIKCKDTASVTVQMVSNDCCKGYVNFVVADSLGNQISNATIKLRQGGVVKADGKTKNGAFLFGPLCEGTYSVLISVDGYFSKEFEYTIKCKDSVQKNVVLSKDGCCRGNFKLMTRDSASYNTMDASYKVMQGGQVIATKSGSNFIALEKYCEGEYTIVVSADNHQTREIKVTVKCNGNDTATVRLPQGDCCKGNYKFMLLDSATNQPIKGTVKLWKGSTLVDTKSGNNYAAFQNICEGEYSVSVTSEDYKGKEFKITIKCNGNDTASVFLASNNCCKGLIVLTVKDSLGMVLKNASVKLRQGGVVKAEGNTKEGAAYFNICEGVYSALITIDGYTAKEMNVSVICNDTTEATAVVSKNCCLGNFKVMLRDSASGKEINGTIKLWKGGTLLATKSGVSSASFEKYCEGTYAISITTENNGSREFQITINCNATDTATVYMASKDCCKGNYIVYLKDSTGKEVTGTIKLWKGSSLVATKTGVTKAKFEQFCEGEYQISITTEKNGNKEFKINIPCNSTDSTTAYMATASDCCKGNFTWNVKDTSNGTALSNVTVKITKSGTLVATKTTSQGVVNFEQICEGNYVATFIYDGYNTKSMEFTVVCNQSKSETAKLSAKDCCKGSIGVTVKDSVSQNPIDSAKVRIYKGSTLIATRYTNANGRIELGDLCNGDYKIIINKDGYPEDVYTFGMGCNEQKNLSRTLVK